MLGLEFGYRLCPLAAAVVKLLLPMLPRTPLSHFSLLSVWSWAIVYLYGRLGLWWVAQRLTRWFTTKTVWHVVLSSCPRAHVLLIRMFSAGYV